MLPTLLSALLLVLAAHAGTVHAEERGQAAVTRPNDDDEEGPDYYEGQDAPLGLTANLDELGPGPTESNAAGADQVATDPLWLNVLGDGALSYRQQEKIAAYTAFRIGKRLHLYLPFDLYAQARFARDQRDIPWDNRVDAGGGLRFILSKRFPLSLAAEFVGGEYLRSSFDVELADGAEAVPTGFFTEERAALIQGLVWGHGAGKIHADEPLFSYPFRFWGMLRSEFLVSNLNRLEASRTGSELLHHRADYVNALVAVHPDIGILCVEGQAGSLAAYATGQVRINTLGNWWDDLAMAGPGLAYQPLRGVDLWLKAEYLRGRYLWDGRKSEPLPYPQNIHDLRIFLDLNYELGI